MADKGIPRIIHQTYKTIDLPDTFRMFHERIKELHPIWEVRLWTDEDNRNLVKEYYPHLLAMYDALPYNIMRVDIIRYIYMDIFGGVYCDLDYEMFQPLDEAIATTELLLPISRDKYEKDYFINDVIIGNCIFGSVPGHIFWKDVLQDFYLHPPLSKFANKLKVLQLTGPEFITSIYCKSPEKYNAELAAKILFHPDSSLIKQKNYKEMLLKKGSFGMHHNTNTWLKEQNSVINVVALLLASVKRRTRGLFSF